MHFWKVSLPIDNNLHAPRGLRQRAGAEQKLAHSALRRLETFVASALLLRGRG